MMTFVCSFMPYEADACYETSSGVLGRSEAVIDRM